MAFFKARVLWWSTAVAAPIPLELTLSTPGVNRKKQESEQQDDIDVHPYGKSPCLIGKPL